MTKYGTTLLLFLDPSGQMGAPSFAHFAKSLP